MSDNAAIAVAREYHAATSHTHFTVHASGHYLDFDNQPIPFKIYETLPPIPLPREWAGANAYSLPGLARLLHHSAGITRKIVYLNGFSMDFRAAANTGALYEIDLYVACGDIEGLGAGLYHFSPHDFALRRLRGGDVRGVLEAASGGQRAAAWIVSTGTFWRNSWKYQARTYRHFGWDNGTLLANLLAVADAMGVAARLVGGFVDDAVNRLLDLDVRREVALSLVALGAGEHVAPVEAPALDYEVRPLSEHEVSYPLMGRLHEASSLPSAGDVLAWRGGEASAPRGSGSPLPAGASVEEVIRRRGSSRRFDARASMSEAHLTAILRAATAPLDADYLQHDVPAARGADPAAPRLNNLYLIVHGVDGIEPGAYFYDGTLVRLASGNFRDQAGYLDLEQDLAGDACLNVYFLTDLDAVLRRYGNRGYRMAQLEAGLLGGRIYLAAYALDLGATGLTFFDEDVVRFFSPHAAGLDTMFLMAVGKPAPRR